MSEKGFSNPISLYDFFRNGKMDNDFVVNDKYITGICLMYPERSAQEHEYMIREKSIVELDSRGLSVCVQEAKTLACEAAIQHLQAGNVVPFPAPAHAEPPAPRDEAPKQKPPAPVTAAPQAEAPAVPSKPAASPTTEPPAPPVQVTPETVPPPVQDKEDLSAEDYEDNNESGGAVRVDLGDLRPASSLLPKASAEEAQGGTDVDADTGEDEEAKQYEKARSTIITVCGKLHDCYQWTAGKILDEKPMYIVELSQRYDGPRTDEKSALQTLYHEAVRRCNAAA